MPRHSSTQPTLPPLFSGVSSGNVGQDAIVLGGVATTVNGTTKGAFQGHCALINNNLFCRLNRGLYGRTHANGVVFTNNAFVGNVGTRAFESDGTNRGSYNIGWTAIDNLIEMDVYAYGMVLTDNANSVFASNSFYDPGSGRLFDFYLGVGTQDNTFILGYHEDIRKIIGGGAAAIARSTLIGQVGVKLPASTTAQASLQFPVGPAPKSPIDGQMWRENNTNTGLKIRINGITKTVTLS